MQGWIKLHRKIRECDMWLDDEPFDRRSAWIDLLLMANHADKKVFFNANLITVKTGSFITSEVKLAERWKWSRWKVDKYLMCLAEDEKIQLEKSNRMTAINIVNWAKYQVDDSESQQQTDSKTTADQQQTNTNKNDKNDKNITPSISPSFLKPTVDEVRAYCRERNNHVDPQVFIDFYTAKGWKVGKTPMKDWQACVRTWEKRGTTGKAANHSMRTYTDINKVGARDLLEDV